MRNPLNKRFFRELKSDAGKYIAIFLFLALFSGAISGFLIANGSVTKTFYESQTKYNLEDGHLCFNVLPDEELISRIEETASLKLYPLFFKEETLYQTGNTVRIYKIRDSVDLVSYLEGRSPENAGEIAVDRMYADNNKLKVGDTVSLNGVDYSVSGLSAVPDYSCLFEKNSDMMFDAINFGIAFMTEDGYELQSDSHESFNYAFKYNIGIKDKVDANSRSESLIESLEKIIKEYDEKIINEKVSSLYADAKTSGQALASEFSKASAKLTQKMTTAFITGGFLSDSIMAKRLGISEEKYAALKKALEDAENLSSSFDSFDEVPEIDLDNIEEKAFDEDGLSAELDKIDGIINAVSDSGLYDCTAMKAEIEKLRGFLSVDLENGLITITDYNPAYTNKAINFVIDDATSDSAATRLMMYIIITVLAFIFAVTISGTILSESAVIGTLRASGFSRTELLAHYITIPIAVTLIGCLVGNILGYTVFEKMFVSVFYTNYSLTKYETAWNANAFVNTTVIPIILTSVINLAVLALKLRNKPLAFLHGDLKRQSKRGAFRLPERLPIFSKFRLRILFTNVPSYLTMFVGIILAGMLVIFGTMFGPLVEDYTKLVADTKIASYQYIVKPGTETADSNAEKYCVTSLETTDENWLTDEILIYGINDESRFVRVSAPADQVILSNGMMDKYGFKVGDPITLKNPYGTESYTFVVGGEYEYYAALSIFMSRSDYLNTFGESDDYFTGYFSDVELSDIESDNVVSVITEQDLLKLVNQLSESLLGFMDVFKALGIVLFLLIMFILTKQVIEKNTRSIAMSKILGFTNGEIGKLYLVITSFVVIVSLLVAIPIVYALLRWMFHSYMYTEMTGYIPYIVSPSSFILMVVLGVASYAAVAAGLMFKLNRISKGEALKNG